MSGLAVRAIFRPHCCGVGVRKHHLTCFSIKNITALHQLLEGGIFNVCDDRPLTQRECYDWLSRHYARALPPPAPPDYERKRGWTSKRVANARLRSLGWSPLFPSFFDAVQAGLDPGPPAAGSAPSDSA